MSLAEPITHPAAGKSSVPRAITGFERPKIHIFCEENGVTSQSARALEHRRLGAGEIRIRKGGLPAAVSAYERTASPELLVIETHLKQDELFAALDRLAGVCDENTRLIIIGQINDVHLYRALIRRSISDYLIAPLAPGQLGASIKAALQPEGAVAGRSVAVIGAKGGCGASTICHNIGWTLAEIVHGDTVIADFDLAFGTLGLNFNQDAGHGLTGALLAGQKLDTVMMEKLLAKCSDYLSLLTASQLLTTQSEIDPVSAQKVVAMLCQTSQVALLDLPCVWHDWTRILIEQADECIIVAEPDLANLRNAKNLIDTLRTMRGADCPPLLVMNKVGMPRRPEITVKDFANAVDLKPSLSIAFDARSFGMAANNGLMIGELSPNTQLAAQFTRLARLLSGAQRTKTPARTTGNPLRPLIDRISRKLAR